MRITNDDDYLVLDNSENFIIVSTPHWHTDKGIGLLLLLSSIGRHSGGFSGNLQRFFSSGMALWRFFWKPPAVFFLVEWHSGGFSGNL